ncbi:MAG TPA: hypothetical protein VKV17_22405 [Bryobacteraceae bacterium]|nr:hypothetical protein [Bryobacteraceae bacterium]
MKTRHWFGLAFAVAASAVAVYGQQHEWQRMLQASGAEQTALIKSYLQAGMPPSDDFGVLIRSRPEVSLPLVEQKIEEVLRSPSSPDNFIDKSVDPQKFVNLASMAIMGVGNVQSLKEISKLMKIDEKRFGHLVEYTMTAAEVRGNPFTVAYQGFEIGDPAIDSRIAAWAEKELLLLPQPPPKDYSRVPGGELLRQMDAHTLELEIKENRTAWAEAMVGKYGGVPSEAQWRGDPIVSRLRPDQADSLHDDMIRRTVEIAEKRAKR